MWEAAFLTIHCPLALTQRPLGGAVKTSESLWTLEDGTLHIQLAKAEEGATWASAIAGWCAATVSFDISLRTPATLPVLGCRVHAWTSLLSCCVSSNAVMCPHATCWRQLYMAGHKLQADEQQADQKRLLLERFQAEVGMRPVLSCASQFCALFPKVFPDLPEFLLFAPNFIAHTKFGAHTRAIHLSFASIPCNCSTRALTFRQPSSLAAPCPILARSCVTLARNNCHICIASSNSSDNPCWRECALL